MKNAKLDEVQGGIKSARRNINNLRYADYTSLMAESKEELKSLLMKMEESEIAGFKLNIQQVKIMASSRIHSVQSLSCVQLCDPVDCNNPGFPVHHHLPELAQTHIHRVCEVIQPSHPLSSPSPPAGVNNQLPVALAKP